VCHGYVTLHPVKYHRTVTYVVRAGAYVFHQAGYFPKAVQYTVKVSHRPSLKVWQGVTGNRNTQASNTTLGKQVKQLQYTVRFTAALAALVYYKRVASLVRFKVLKKYVT
jgi:hypothetical protein